MPAPLPKPPKEVLYQLYEVDRRSYREIMDILNVKTGRAIKRWLLEYEIPIRTGSEAVKTQWENNEKRKTFQAEKLRHQSYGNTQRRISDEVYIKRFHDKKLKFMTREFVNGYSVFTLECLLCNHVFKKTLTNPSSGCPSCCISKGETKVRDTLDSLGFKYEREYKFIDCKNEQSLRFDFAVFDDKGKLLCLIEYDGEFHFGKVIKKETKRNRFSEILKRDQIKNSYCKRKRIKLIRISFLNFDNIEQILANNLLKQPSLF